MARITVFTWSRALGDTLLLAFALRALRDTYPAGVVTLVGCPEPAGLLAAAGLVDEVLDNGDPGLSGLATGVVGQAVLKSALGNPDWALISTSRVEQAKAALASANIRGLVVSPFPPPGVHVARHLVDALSVIGVSPPDQVLLNPLSSSPRHVSGPICLHPGAGAAWKCAPPELFREVAQRLVDSEHEVVVLQGPADGDQVAAMRWEGSIIRPDSLRDLPEILASAKAFVGNDSGVTHLASLLGVPTVALFGPTHPATWSPIGPAVKIVRACSEPPRVEVRVCRDPHCLEGISPEDVLAALNRLLAQPNQRKMAELLD